MRCELLYLLFLLGCCCRLCYGDIFLVSPGDGNEFMYSPVDVNATFHCIVNNTDLSWDVDTLTFDNIVERLRLHSRGIFQNEPVTSSSGVTTSSVTVLGRVPVNNNCRICCQSVVDERDIHINCTTLILYDRPAPLDDVRVGLEYSTEATRLLNISWRATEVTGVIQNYIVYFQSHKVETSQLYYIYQLNTIATKCGEFLAFITAVNGAGESDPSNNVTIPSLPDIGPVTTSLSHLVWKSAGGEIMVNVLFKSAKYCTEYPLLGYTVLLKSLQSGALLNMSINFTETKIVIGPQEGLQDNQRYEYAISALNSFGNTTSHEDGKWQYFFTSELQSVTATVVGESTIDIQCLFIHGSDAVGCKVVLVSECSSIKDEQIRLSRTAGSQSATKQLSLSHNVKCYSCVFAYEIDVNNTVNNFTINGRINPMMINKDSNSKKSHLSARVIIIVTVTFAAVIFPLAIIIIAVIPAVYFKHLKKKKCEKSKNIQDDKSICQNELDECQPPGSLYCELTTLTSKPAHFTSTEKASTVIVHISPLESVSQAPHLNSPMASSPPESSAPNVSVNDGSSNDIETSPDTKSSDSSLAIPVYAVPDKLRKRSKQESQNVQETQDEEEHFYHVLENDRDTPKVVPSDKNLTFNSPDSTSQFSPENPSPVYQDIKEITNKPKESDDSLQDDGDNNP